MLFLLYILIHHILLFFINAHKQRAFPEISLLPDGVIFNQWLEINLWLLWILIVNIKVSKEKSHHLLCHIGIPVLEALSKILNTWSKKSMVIFVRLLIDFSDITNLPISRYCWRHDTKWALFYGLASKTLNYSIFSISLSDSILMNVPTKLRISLS